MHPERASLVSNMIKLFLTSPDCKVAEVFLCIDSVHRMLAIASTI